MSNGLRFVGFGRTGKCPSFSLRSSEHDKFKFLEEYRCHYRVRVRSQVEAAPTFRDKKGMREPSISSALRVSFRPGKNVPKERWMGEHSVWARDEKR